MTDRSIADVAADLGLAPHEWEPFGRSAAKLEPHVAARGRRGGGPSRLVLVTAITPTPAGEGKTTTSIGLAQGMRRLGASVCLALREPSVGPCFGAKGGGTGSGRAALVPAERINLHFTGDLHAVASAHNLLAALIDNHLHHGNPRRIDPRRVLWKRAIDMNDRALRHMVVGLGGRGHGVPREDAFLITAASEVMAMLCLADDAEDLRARLARTLVAFDVDGAPVTALDLGAPGAMLALLADAMRPNLVQTIEGVPALVHGGPFANIAHGCSSVVATRAAMHLADWAITEAGFGTELGAEKFFDIKCRTAGLDPAAVVVVATVRALKMHGGVPIADLARRDADAVRRGLPNLEAHVANVRAFGRDPVVALNRFTADSNDEIAVVSEACENMCVPFAVSDHHEAGGEGAIDLARAVMAQAGRARGATVPLYPADAPFEDKLAAIAHRLYGAGSIAITRGARRDLEEARRIGLGGLPPCVAKAHTSLSDDPARRGRPSGFEMTVEAIEIAAGAGYLVVSTGDIVRMPGLPKRPRAEVIDFVAGRIVGVE